MKVELPEMHPTLREFIKVATRRKWVSYEELNTIITLPVSFLARRRSMSMSRIF